MNMRFILTAALAALVGTAAHAQPLPKTQLKIVGGLSNLAPYTDFEKPFWTTTVPSLSGGQITADIKGFNEMGLKGPEMLRLMSQGVVEFGTATLSYFASDDPINEAVDLAGLTTDAKTQRQVVAAFEPVYEKLYGGANGVKLLGLSPYPAQVLFCNADMKGLADLKGKKVRTSSRTQAELIESTVLAPRIRVATKPTRAATKPSRNRLNSTDSGFSPPRLATRQPTKVASARALISSRTRRTKVAAVSTEESRPVTRSIGASVAMRASSAIRYSASWGSSLPASRRR